ncbi:DotU family type IV/VI secretion system protein [Sesbania bispinosa]|nr:DotU family type IV/VI secretion system protein [Sesbania bispinosa]
MQAAVAAKGRWPARNGGGEEGLAPEGPRRDGGGLAWPRERPPLLTAMAAGGRT